MSNEIDELRKENARLLSENIRLREQVGCTCPTEDSSCSATIDWLRNTLSATETLAAQFEASASDMKLAAAEMGRHLTDERVAHLNTLDELENVTQWAKCAMHRAYMVELALKMQENEFEIANMIRRARGEIQAPDIRGEFEV